MTGAQASSIVAVKVLVEEDVVAPVRILLELPGAAVDRAPALPVAQEDVAQPPRDLRGDLLRMTGRRCRSFDRWSPCVAFSHHQVPASHGPLEAAERRYSGLGRGRASSPALEFLHLDSQRGRS